MAFITSVSKFHNFRATQDLVSFPDWLMVFHQEDSVFHVNVLGRFLHTREAQIITEVSGGLLCSNSETPPHLSSTFVFSVLD